MHMNHVFSKGKRKRIFSWENLTPQRIQEGRGELGTQMPVLIHRLMDNALYEVLSQQHGEAAANSYFRMAGVLAGRAFASNVLDSEVSTHTFLANLQEAFIQLKIGILRVEHHDANTGEIIITVGEDIGCSGLPVTNETVCHYDEGFLTGVFQMYTKQSYEFQEIDCWANGARFCRFKGLISMQ